MFFRRGEGKLSSYKNNVFQKKVVEPNPAIFHPFRTHDKRCVVKAVIVYSLADTLLCAHTPDFFVG